MRRQKATGCDVWPQRRATQRKRGRTPTKCPSVSDRSPPFIIEQPISCNNKRNWIANPSGARFIVMLVELMDPYTSVWNRKLLRLCVFLKTSSIINLPQPLKTTLIGRVCLHSAELIKWQKSALLTVNLCIHTLSLPSITANSFDRWSKKEDDVVLDWGSPSSQLLRRWIMVIFMLPGDLLQPPPGSVGAVVVVEGYVT